MAYSVSALFGTPAMYLVMAVGGGGAFALNAVLAHLRPSRQRVAA